MEGRGDIRHKLSAIIKRLEHRRYKKGNAGRPYGSQVSGRERGGEDREGAQFPGVIRGRKWSGPLPQALWERVLWKIA